MRTRAHLARRPYVAAGVCVALLAVWDIAVRPALAENVHVEGGLVVAACLVGVAFWGGLDVDRLGLSPRRVPAGLAWGALAFAAVTVVVLLGLVLPTTRSSFHAAQGEISGGELLLQVLVVIPIGTVVVEELAFRGALLGLLREAMPSMRAVIVCSVLFGLWHIPGVLADSSGSTFRTLGAVVGTFIATFVAGLVFCWLRIKSGSLVAPALAHLATNTVALVVAWMVVH